MGRAKAPGLLLHKGTGQWYRTIDGKREYFGTDKEVAEIRWHRFEAMRDTVKIIIPRATFPSEAARWRELGVTPHPITEEHRRVPRKTIRELVAAHPELAKPQPSEVASGGVKLRDLIKPYRSLKLDEGVDEQQIDRSVRIFERFISVTKNKPLADLNADDFASWRRWVSREYGKMPETHNENHSRLKTFFTDCRRDQPSLPWPVGLTDWMILYKPLAVATADGNDEPMPLDDFKRLIKAAQFWADSDPSKIDRSTNKGRGKYRIAAQLPADGLRWLAMLRLATNAALADRNQSANLRRSARTARRVHSLRSWLDKNCSRCISISGVMS